MGIPLPMRARAQRTLAARPPACCAVRRARCALRALSLSVELISRYFIETFSKRFAMDRQSAPADRAERERMRVAAMQSIGQELAAIGGSKPFRYPESFPFILRAFTALEGIGKTLDPKYDVYRIARRYIPELVDLKDGNVMLTAVKGVQKRCAAPRTPRKRAPRSDWQAARARRAPHRPRGVARARAWRATTGGGVAGLGCAARI